MQKWEYQIVKGTEYVHVHLGVEYVLNMQGEEGWELVTAGVGGDDNLYIMKRPVD